ncbi:MAG: histidine--tRNA ligase [Spirochaetia bacterium]|jgi:histidyl-tRNA synthetase
MSALIEPRIPKGFRDFLPDRESRRLAIIRSLEQVFDKFGFAPIDTPVLEFAEVLLGKGGGETDKEVYRFTDHGGRDVAMRFDLTVPFARFMAAHLTEVGLPFRRWHAAKVWRGENTQRGRYREFMQIDFDVVGADSASADLEILLLMRESMATLGMERSCIRFAHRGLFNAFLGLLGLESRSVDVLRAIDKQRKTGEEKTREMLEEIAGARNAGRIMDFTRAEGSAARTLEKLKEAAGGTSEGIHRLGVITQSLEQLGISGSFALDPSITRGLDYYTGIVFETFLSDLPDIGSVCSGGRYNDLASLYTKQSLPGVGASIGVDRLMAAMEELGLGRSATPGASVLILFLEDGLLGKYHGFAQALRAAGVAAEVYPEKKKLAVQFAYAEKKGIALALVCGEQEARTGVVGLKDVRSRQSFDGLSLEAAIEKARELLR